jgi:type III secretory pathway lipoprotein EscJ
VYIVANELVFLLSLPLDDDQKLNDCLSEDIWTTLSDITGVSDTFYCFCDSLKAKIYE